MVVRLYPAQHAPRAVASVKAFLESKELHVRNIDDVNTEQNCLYVSFQYGVVGTPNDSMWGLLGLQQRLQFRDLTVQEMRDAAADTIGWVLDMEWAPLYDSLRLHIDVEVREYLGPRGRGTLVEAASYELGTKNRSVWFCVCGVPLVLVVNTGNCATV